MANTIKALYRNDTWSLATYYQSFNASSLRSIRMSEYASTWINIMWSIYWQHQIIKKWERFIADWDYIACWQASSWSTWLLFILTDSSATQVINYVFKTRTELWSNYNTYRDAFRWTMTDEIRNEVRNLFSISLTVTTSWNEILISDGGQSITINTTSHNMRYNADYYTETSNTSTEYSILQTNWWLVDWTYTYQWVNQDWNDIISSLKAKWVINVAYNYDTVNGEITISNWPLYTFTTSDKNLGAINVYNNGDTISNDNLGNFYQRWNNFPFVMWNEGTYTVNAQWVDVSNYWPWNNYNSQWVFNASSADYMLNINENLWWETTNTDIARQWPCSAWWHIPSAYEVKWIVFLRSVLKDKWLTQNSFVEDFKMPARWPMYCQYSGGQPTYIQTVSRSGYGSYWTTTHSWDSKFYSLRLDWGAGSVTADVVVLKDGNWPSRNVYGLLIRPFKNTVTS